MSPRKGEKKKKVRTNIVKAGVELTDYSWKPHQVETPLSSSSETDPMRSLSMEDPFPNHAIHRMSEHKSRQYEEHMEAQMLV